MKVSQQLEMKFIVYDASPYSEKSENYKTLIPYFLWFSILIIFQKKKTMFLYRLLYNLNLSSKDIATNASIANFF